jgi:hypothetical protein
MIYLTGDTHAEFSRLGNRCFPEQKMLSKQDILIILGDFGGIWHDDRQERYWLDWLNDRPYTIAYVDGNHENYDRYYSNEFPIVDFFGGKAHQIRESVFHLLRGELFEFEGKRFFAFGGASSHDIRDGILDPTAENFKETYRKMRKQWKQFRVNHLSWWKEELPSEEELRHGRENLEAVNYQVDFVLSHCLPQRIAQAFPPEKFPPDKLTLYFDSLLSDGLEFQGWYCGHYHTTRSLEGRFHVLYEDIVRVL